MIFSQGGAIPLARENHKKPAAASIHRWFTPHLGACSWPRPGRGSGLIGGPRDPFIVELVQAGAGELSYSGVMPHALYVEGPPQQRDGPDMVDRMVELLQPHLEKKMAERDDPPKT